MSKPTVIDSSQKEDFIGKYLGSTDQIRRILSDVNFQPLFIEDAYAEGGRDGAETSEFSHEVIDTLNEYLSDHPRRRVLVLPETPEEKQFREHLDSCFVKINPENRE